MKMKLTIYNLFFIFLTTIAVISCSLDINFKENNMNPIPEYQNYFFNENGQLYGFDEQGIKSIEITDKDENPVTITDFFIKGGDLFFTVTGIDEADPENPIEIETYYKQSGETVTTVSSLPTKPTLSRSQLNNEEFTIENFDYEGSPCSDVKNIVTESGIERFFMVDGFSHFPGIGLFFNVSDGRYNEKNMVRDKALYFWPLDKPSINMVMDSGELW